MDLAAKRASLKVTSIADKILSTFGPNPCTQLTLTTQTGDYLNLICDSKRCPDCSPRKQATMQLQLSETFGVNTYITTYQNTDELNRTIDRERKQARRTGTTFLYQSVGDNYLGHILITNTPTHTDHRRTNLQDWMKRIINNWLYGDNRIRRSRAIGRMSLVTLRRRAQSGTSPWSRLTEAFVSVRERLLKAEMDRRDALVQETGWHVWEENGKWVSTVSAWQVDQ